MTTRLPFLLSLTFILNTWHSGRALTPLPPDPDRDAPFSNAREQKILDRELTDILEALQVLRSDLARGIGALESALVPEQRRRALGEIRILRRQLSRTRFVLDDVAGHARWLARSVGRVDERVSPALTRLAEQDLALIDRALAELESAAGPNLAGMGELVRAACDRVVDDLSAVQNCVDEIEKLERILEQLHRMRLERSGNRDAGGQASPR